jgi:NADH dehydrogenase [ubiquinone] 1 alpha subcomplex assembly factor 7
VTALKLELEQLIATEGPLTVSRYMALCLGHPVHGYYATRDPFGAGGDFTTAPEISQMFGELIGLWAVETWNAMGAPSRLYLIELGPGRGTLMGDLLRAARVVPGFLEAIEVHLVETSPLLRARQRHALQSASVPIGWHASVSEVPDGPVIAIANEFFDALPIRQFVRTEADWRERVVGLDGRGELTFGLASAPEPRLSAEAPRGAVFEWSEAAVMTAQTVATRVAREGGAALVVDYGHEGPAIGDTLQAVRRHRFADPLAAPGDADLTAHVDFGALDRAARAVGARTFGPMAQGDFLRTLGIEPRAAALKARATPPQAAAVEAAVERLCGTKTGSMGALFKTFAFAHPSLSRLPGFSEAGGRRPDAPRARAC